MEEIGIKLEDILITGFNPRQFKKNDPCVLETQASMKEIGQLAPVLVRPNIKDVTKWDLADGDIRLTAAHNLKWKTIRAIVRELTDLQMKEIMLVTSVRKANLNAMEEAKGIKQLLDDDKSQKDIAGMLGKSQSWVSNRVKLLHAPKEIREWVLSKELLPKHAAIAMSVIDYPKIMEEVLGYISASVEDEEHCTSESMIQMMEWSLVDHFENIDSLEPSVTIDGDVYRSDKYIKEIDLKSCQDKCAKTFIFNNSCWCTDKSCLDRMVLAAVKEHEEGKGKSSKKKKGDPDGDDDVADEAITSTGYRDLIRNRNKKLIAKGKTFEDFPKVDTDKLDYSDYKNLSWLSVDKTVCKSCPEHVISKKNSEDMCLKPACYSKRRNHGYIEGHRRIMESIDMWVDEYGLDIMPEMVGRILRRFGDEYRHHAYDLDDVMGYDEEYLYTQLSPNEQIAVAVKCLFISVNGYNVDTPLETLKKFWDGDLKKKPFSFYKKTKSDSVLVHVKKKETHKTVMCKFPMAAKTVNLQDLEAESLEKVVTCKACSRAARDHWEANPVEESLEEKSTPLTGKSKKDMASPPKDDGTPALPPDDPDGLVGPLPEADSKPSTKKRGKTKQITKLHLKADIEATDALCGEEDPEHFILAKHRERYTDEEVCAYCRHDHNLMLKEDKEHKDEPGGKSEDIPEDNHILEPVDFLDGIDYAYGEGDENHTLLLTKEGCDKAGDILVACSKCGTKITIPKADYNKNIVIMGCTVED